MAVTWVMVGGDGNGDYSGGDGDSDGGDNDGGDSHSDCSDDDNVGVNDGDSGDGNNSEYGVFLTPTQLKSTVKLIEDRGVNFWRKERRGREKRSIGSNNSRRRLLFLSAGGSQAFPLCQASAVRPEAPLTPHCNQQLLQ